MISRGVRAPIPRMNSTENNYIYRLAMNIAESIEGAQWLSGRVLDSRPKDLVVSHVSPTSYELFFMGFQF